MIATFLALFALVLVASAAFIALLWRAKPVPAVWVASALGTLGLILAAASLTINLADLGTVLGVVLLTGILGAGWNPQRKSIYLVVGYAGLLAGIVARFIAFTSTLEISTIAASNTIPWGLTRSAGFVAFLCATGSVIFGARRPSNLPLRGLPARIYALHRALGIVAILARSCTWSRCGRTTSSSSPLLSFCSCPEPPCTSRSLSPWAG